MQDKLHLPFPPTVNNLFVNVPGRGRVPSQRYKDWREDANRLLLTQVPLPRFLGPVSLKFTFGRPDARRRDLSNLIKAAEDMIVSAGVIEDDSKVHRIVAEWGASSGCTVTIEALA